MDDLETNISKAISLCEGNFEYYNTFCRMYTFATENISGYLKYFDLKNKSLLTVGSSCDQVLNAAYCGARDITLYDINDYAKYYFYLKMASILSLDYKQFKLFFFKHGYGMGEDYYNKQMFCKDTFNKIKSTLRLLDYESYLFFDELFALYDVETIRDCLFNDDECRNQVITNFNVYLNDETTYNKMKSIIKKISFKYIQGDIFKDNISGEFDNILLSNICTTISNLDILKELLKKLDANNLRDDGSILVGYLWNVDYDSMYYEKYWAEIYKLPITKEKLKEYITEHHRVKDSISIVHDFNQEKDLVLIYRK